MEKKNYNSPKVRLFVFTGDVIRTSGFDDNELPPAFTGVSYKSQPGD